jgi:hypothetical protein
MMLAPIAWSQGDYHLSVSQATELKQVLKNHPTATRDVREHRMEARILQEGKLDCLMMDTPKEEWIQWMKPDKRNRNPQCIVWMAPSDCLGKEEDGPLKSLHRKLFDQLGYDIQYWYLKAELHGAALKQDQLATILTQQGCVPGRTPTKPAPMTLPPRPMSNPLMPFGVPPGEWYHGKVSPAPLEMTRQWQPYAVEIQIEETPVFSPSEPMPDAVNVWTSTEKGVRRVQIEELSKAKGMPSNRNFRNSGRAGIPVQIPAF